MDQSGFLPLTTVCILDFNSFIHSFIQQIIVPFYASLAVLKTEGFFVLEGEDWGLDFSGKVIAIHIQEKSKKESSVPPKNTNKKSRKKEGIYN